MSLTHSAARPAVLFRERRQPALDALVCSPWFVAVAATVIGLWAVGLYRQAGLLLIQGDSVAHLDTARGVFDSLTPSFAQLGGVWLPLPHLLMLPLIWIDPLWRSGLAGSLPSVVAFALAAVYIQQIALLLTGNRAVGLCAAALFVTNPNMLFMQATPMTEALTIFLVIASTYHLLRFVREGSFLHLLANAGFVAAATLSRYETWVLIPATGCVVAFAAFRQRRDRGYVEAALIVWGLLAVYGVALWLLYNKVIFGDMLNFEHGPGSALSFTEALAKSGRLPDRGNLPLAFRTYGWAVIDNIGVPLAIATIAALGVLALARRSLSEKLALLVPLSIFAFSVASLYRGESVIELPNLWPHNFYNDRYGLLVLPGAVIVVCMLAHHRQRLGLVALAALLCLQLNSLPGVLGATSADEATMTQAPRAQIAADWVAASVPVLDGRQPITVFEAEIEDANGDQSTSQAAAWLRAQSPRGHVLVSEQAAGLFVFDTALPLHTFVSEGTKPEFQQALLDPTRYVSWIVFRPRDPRDLLAPLVQGHTPAGYRVVYDNGDYRIFARIGE